MDLPARALRTIRKHDLFPRGARVLVALSGGPDSVALLHILRVLEGRGELAVAGVAHFNHLLRGDEADADEAFCRRCAAECALPVEVGRADVGALARASGRSIEDTARGVRYAFLAEVAQRLRADAVAIGHSEDDQAETFLLRLMRGAGARGLGGIRPRAGLMVRPLLEISRANLREYSARHDLAFREDASNLDVRIPRNRVRHQVIPELERMSPAVVRILAREAEVARLDEEYLEAAAIEWARAHVSRTEHAVQLDAAALATLPRALASRVARAALESGALSRFVGVQHIDRVLALAAATDGTSVSLPGQLGTRRGDVIVLGSRSGTAPFPSSVRHPLAVPGEVVLPGWVLSAERLDAVELPRLPPRAHEAVVALEPVRPPLAVRTRRRGDRFRPFGMGGRGRKLQDFLVDRKVARTERDYLPLVVDGDDRIVWVAGQSIAEEFRVTAPVDGVILLKARRLGGVG